VRLPADEVVATVVTIALSFGSVAAALGRSGAGPCVGSLPCDLDPYRAGVEISGGGSEDADRDDLRLAVHSKNALGVVWVGEARLDRFFVLIIVSLASRRGGE
jgi:hypothetical protein